jgi:uncharacterized protein YuzE
MRTEYFPDSDPLSFLFSEEDGAVADGRNVEDDEDVEVLYDAEDRIAEIVIHHASRRFPLDRIAARVISDQASAAPAS